MSDDGGDPSTANEFCPAGTAGERCGVDLLPASVRADPSLRAMFRDDIELQARSFMDTLATLMASLDRTRLSRNCSRTRGSGMPGTASVPTTIRSWAPHWRGCWRMSWAGTDPEVRAAWWSRLYTLVTESMLAGCAGAVAGIGLTCRRHPEHRQADGEHRSSKFSTDSKVRVPAQSGAKLHDQRTESVPAFGRRWTPGERPRKRRRDPPLGMPLIPRSRTCRMASVSIASRGQPTGRAAGEYFTALDSRLRGCVGAICRPGSATFRLT